MSGRIGEKKHFAHKSVEWYTPKWIFDELGLTFDLDPASPHDHETAVPAAMKYTVFDNGLLKPWYGRVFLNPPYCRDIGKWTGRMIDNNSGILVVFSRTDAKWFHQCLETGAAVLFMRGRIEFVPGHENKHKKSRAGAGTAIFAWGRDCADALHKLHPRGAFIFGPGHKP